MLEQCGQASRNGSNAAPNRDNGIREGSCSIYHIPVYGQESNVPFHSCIFPYVLGSQRFRFFQQSCLWELAWATPPVSKVARSNEETPITTVDIIVIGGGLAGSTLAWQAHRMGLSVALIDRPSPRSCSRVAAGLVTPITGTRGAASWRWGEFYSAANSFYVHIESVTHRSFWRTEPAIHIYRNETEKKVYQERWIENNPATAREPITVTSLDDVALSKLRMPHGACSFEPAARLNTVAYLDATREYFESINSYYAVDIQCDQDLDLQNSEHVRIHSLDLTGKRIALCQGFAARENALFSDLPLHPARGDILEIESPNVEFQSIVHGDAWVVPTRNNCFLVGATYDRFELNDNVESNNEPATRFRTELMSRWEAMVGGSFAAGDHIVLDQRAAVRPASFDRHPLLGQHKSLPNVFCLNGMGSKGTLMAPRLAHLLLESMQGNEIERSLNWRRRT